MSKTVNTLTAQYIKWLVVGLLILLFLVGCVSRQRIKSVAKTNVSLNTVDTMLQKDNPIETRKTIASQYDSLSKDTSLIENRTLIKDTTLVSDTLLVEKDSILIKDTVLKNDTALLSDSILTIPPKVKKAENAIDAEIEYSATDSIVFFANGTGYLYGNTDIKYKEMNLKEANYVRVLMDSAMVYAYSTTDSTGNKVGKPVFSDGNMEYTSNELAYNFNTRRGFVRQTVTQQGDGYIISSKTKLIDNNIINMAGGKYTTCDLHDAPHFYLSLSKAKARPGKNVIAGPSHLVLLDVPMPAWLPFAYFPFNSKYSSGIEAPSFDTDFTRGYGLVNGGYYFAINDYVDLSVKGDVYTRGTWGVNIMSNYLKRYKFNGGLSVSYREDVVGDKDIPQEYQKSKNLSIRWSHSQNPKVNPFRTFSASVNFSTSGYDRSNINSYYTSINAQNTKSSSISFSQRFPNNPFSITANLGVDQRTRDSTISLTLPNVSISMSRIYPLKRKNRVGKERWYEKISMSYSGSLSNSITTKENQLLKSSFVNDWRNGMQHNIPVSASFNLLNYITISPNFNYRERWYLYSTTQSWDEHTQKVISERESGFNRVFDFNMGVSMNTTLYGMYIPNKKIFGNKIVAIRHKIDPSISVSFTPDFGASKWGYWDTYTRTYADPNDATRTLSEQVYYSKYQNSLYGGPGRGKSSSLSFSLGNNIEMKRRVNERDTIISLIDNFSVSGGYNFAADSLRWSNFSTNLRIKFGSAYTLSLSGAFDPYMYGYAPDGKTVRRINKLRWNNGRFPRFLGTSLSYGYTFSNETFKRKGKKKTDNKENEKQDENAFAEDPNNPQNKNSLNLVNKGTNKSVGNTEYDEDGYEKFSLPWSLTVNYSVRISEDFQRFDPKKMDYKRKLTNNLNFSGNIQLTPGWQISGTTSYDFSAKQFTYTSFNVTRNLHCWTLTGNFVPFGPYKTYGFRIGVNSSMLQDLKYEKQGNRGVQSRVTWY